MVDVDDKTFELELAVREQGEHLGNVGDLDEADLSVIGSHAYELVRQAFSLPESTQSAPSINLKPRALVTIVGREGRWMVECFDGARVFCRKPVGNHGHDGWRDCQVPLAQVDHYSGVYSWPIGLECDSFLECLGIRRNRGDGMKTDGCMLLREAANPMLDRSWRMLMLRHFSFTNLPEWSTSLEMISLFNAAYKQTQVGNTDLMLMMLHAWGREPKVWQAEADRLMKDGGKGNWIRIAWLAVFLRVCGLNCVGLSTFMDRRTFEASTGRHLRAWSEKYCGGEYLTHALIRRMEDMGITNR